MFSAQQGSVERTPGKAATMRHWTVSVMILLLLLPAATALGGFENGEVVTVSLPVGDDLYIAGGRITVTEPVAGDLVAAGGTMILNGPVGEDLQIAGGSLLVNAPVRDDVRAAGGDVVLSSSVGGDLMVIGGSVTIPAGAVVEGDAVIGAGTLVLQGTIRGDLLAHAGVLDLQGTVLGDARLYATDRIAINGGVDGDTVFAGPSARLGPHARFEKDVSYWLEKGEMDFGQARVGGRVRFDPELRSRKIRYPVHPEDRRGSGYPGGFFVATFLSGIVVVALMTLSLKGVFRRAGQVLDRSFWQSTGVGLLTLLLLPVAGLLAMVTLVGMPVGVFLLAVFLFSLVFGRAIAAIAFAAWLEHRRAAPWNTGRLLLVSVGLYAAVKLVTLVPFVGWLTALLAVMAGYGALVLGIYRGRTVS